MPLYEYGCKKCKKKFEVLRKFSDTSPVTCPKCGTDEVEKKPATFSVPSAPGLSKTEPGKGTWESS